MGNIDNAKTSILSILQNDMMLIVLALSALLFCSALIILVLYRKYRREKQSKFIQSNKNLGMEMGSVTGVSSMNVTGQGESGMLNFSTDDLPVVPDPATDDDDDEDEKDDILSEEEGNGSDSDQIYTTPKHNFLPVLTTAGTTNIDSDDSDDDAKDNIDPMYNKPTKKKTTKGKTTKRKTTDGNTMDGFV